jgi:hypothetical protein
MTRKKLKTSELQDTKTKYLRSFQKTRKYLIGPLVKLHTKKIRTPKLTRRKLKIPKFQNTNTKNFQSSHEKKAHTPISSLVKLHTKI